MTTDITELAQQELAQLRAELSNQAIGSKDHLRKIALSLVDKLEKCRDREIRWLALSDEKSKIITDQEEALEKAQASATQQGNIACALFDEVTQLRRHADEKAPELRAQLIEADSELEALRQRIAELESRTVTIKLSKDHVDDADLFGWGVIVVPLEALKEACADAGVSVEITAAGGKVEAE
ncbi:Uncharacterised protein [Raoultella ornithinolytica]|uniref:hypothetical protein n=1 Tax=Raoultella ornithinolytica TaxID=54291 RepID=UPI0007CBE5B7|nr:hypothetical protein [Raoultella ornithinolytica]SBL37754.1 Uncharacterised protein [Raoultella ornithinolytica]